MLSLLTPTTGRPQSFARLEKYVQRQTYKGPVEWIVCGENLDGYAFTLGQKVIHRQEASTLHSVNANYLACVNAAQGDVWLCLEDDDAYHENYFAVMTDALSRFPLCGLSNQVYYHLPSRRYESLGNTHHASLASTGFTREVLPTFLQGVTRAGTPFIDAFLWCHWSQTLALPALLMPCQLPGGRVLQLGLKDGTGVGLGHKRQLRHADPDGSELRELLGVEAYSWYGLQNVDEI